MNETCIYIACVSLFFWAAFNWKDIVRGREDILPDWGHSEDLIFERFF